MTCDEINEQIAELTAQFNALSQDQSNLQNQINVAYYNAVSGDIYGGTYPSTPITIAGLQARIAYLNTRNPVPQATINAYSAIIGQLESLGGIQATITQTVASLGGMKQAAIDQGC